MNMEEGTAIMYKGDDVREDFEKAYCSVEGSFRSSREPHLVMEPECVQAYWDENDVLTIQCKSQNLYGNIGAIADAIGLPKDRIRIRRKQ